MAINVKDTKILWAKAAGICSMTNCKKQLILESNATSNSTLIGENCHIVAEKEDGPRGISNISEQERNSYNNLILLCRDHHKMIDDDTITWTVEKLHEIKSNHELWVELNLNQSNKGFNEFYIKIANEVIHNLYIHSWNIVSDNIVRTIMPEQLYDNIRNLVIRLETISWPPSNASVNEAFKEVSYRLNIFINNYTSNSYLRDNNCYIEDKRWKRTWHSQELYEQYIENSKIWFNNHYKYFRNLVVVLNRLFFILRESIDPLYLIDLGNLTISDEFGALGNGMDSMVYLPYDIYE